MIGYVINLDRAPERWTSVARIAAERGLAVERVQGVDGREPAMTSAAAVAPGSALTPPEIGCFESHRKVWAIIAATPAPAGLVLEDDVYLGSGIMAFLDALQAQAGALDLVKLNVHPRGMIVATQPVGVVQGRQLLTPAQTTSDSSAYVITRDFAARALAIHDGYDRALDLALFDPATGARVAQVDPALTTQQRYADFRFLDEGALKTHIQRERPRRPRQGLLAALSREAERVWRRRIVPAAQPVLNLARSPEKRLSFRRIPYDG